MRHQVIFHTIILAFGLVALAACRAPTGDLCTVSSDCPSNQICHPNTRTCTEIQCEEGVCHSDTTQSAPDVVTKADTDTEKACETEGRAGWRITVFEVLKAGAERENPEEGRLGTDVDNDPDTCAPAPCDDGFDNGFVKVSLFNDVFAKSIQEELIAMAFLQTEESLLVFDVNGALTSGKAHVLSSSFDPDSLQPISSVPISSADDEKISAAGGFMKLKLLVAGVPLVLPIEHLTVQGSLGDAMDVLIGGAITESALEKAVYDVPADELPDVVPDHDQLMTTIRILYVVDADMDDEEGAESITINLRFQGTPTTLCMPDLSN